MILYPSIMELMEKSGSRYSLVIAAAKRARQISEEAADSDNKIDGARSITKAVEEIHDGEIEIVNSDNNETIDAEEEEKEEAEALSVE